MSTTTNPSLDSGLQYRSHHEMTPSPDAQDRQEDADHKTWHRTGENNDWGHDGEWKETIAMDDRDEMDMQVR